MQFMIKRVAMIVLLIALGAYGTVSLHAVEAQELLLFDDFNGPGLDTTLAYGVSADSNAVSVSVRSKKGGKGNRR